MSDYPKYSLKKLRDFFSSKKMSIVQQFVNDNIIIFIKLYIESIGEYILLYFPSKYNISKDSSIPSIEIVSYDLMDIDYLQLQQYEENETNEHYSELQLDEFSDDVSIDDHYRPIDIKGNSDNIIRKKMVSYINQLKKFRNCTQKIPYKFGVLTNDILCNINRHNEIDSFIIKDGGGCIVNNIIDSKSETIYKIEHDLHVIIDLPSFFEKINQAPTDIIKLYKYFYNMLNKAHTKQVAIAGQSLKNYQNMVNNFTSLYVSKQKFLDLMGTLTSSLEKSINQEEEIMEKISIINKNKDDVSTITADKERSFKMSKNEQELIKIKEVKKKTIILLQEVKRKYHDFMLSFDSCINVIIHNLRIIENNFKILGITSYQNTKK